MSRSGGAAPASDKALRLAAILCACLWFCGRAHAQPLPEWTPRAEELLQLRLHSHDQRETAGYWLLGWGVANAVGGGLLAGIGHGSEVSVAAGVTAASFGVINALLAPSLLDLSGSRRARILAERPRTREDLERLRAAALVEELQRGQTFAVNFGLDVAYITAGALLFIIGRLDDSGKRWPEAAGITLAVQGAFLLGFDLRQWLGANGRAASLRR